MCGIIGINGKTEVSSRLLDGLRRLEYRGYDSAGVASLDQGKVHRCRAMGKLHMLAEKLGVDPLSGKIGIGHTRWATHGPPSEANAHPHISPRAALVHNGIIENDQDLRAELAQNGYPCHSDTDSEVILWLVTQLLDEGVEPFTALQRVVARLSGAFSLALLCLDQPDVIFAARRGTPLVLGYGQGEMFLASDVVGLTPLTSKISYLEDGDMAEIHQDYVRIIDGQGQEISRSIITHDLNAALIGKGNYRHFMRKEIHEQPEIIAENCTHFCKISRGKPSQEQGADLSDFLTLPADLDFTQFPQISVLGCGTAFYAGMTAKYWFENWARMPVAVDIASEFRYRHPPLQPGGLSICVSQSGETADTLEAMQIARRAGQKILAVVNAPHSALARQADYVLLTQAGPEIGVASTKAFTSQLVVLGVLALAAGWQCRQIVAKDMNSYLAELRQIPGHMTAILQREDDILPLARELEMARNVLYIGRDICYPLALEAALKLKEISYIHAEGFAAGELKHGPIALIDESVPVVLLAPSTILFEKTLANAQAAVARGARLICISDQKGIERLAPIATQSFLMPAVSKFTAPLLYALPIQLLAYHTAVMKGTDIDQPRNLAKSVTVE